MLKEFVDSSPSRVWVRSALDCVGGFPWISLLSYFGFVWVFSGDSISRPCRSSIFHPRLRVPSRSDSRFEADGPLHATRLFSAGYTGNWVRLALGSRRSEFPSSAEFGRFWTDRPFGFVSRPRNAKSIPPQTAPRPSLQFSCLDETAAPRRRLQLRFRLADSDGFDNGCINSNLICNSRHARIFTSGLSKDFRFRNQYGS